MKAVFLTLILALAISYRPLPSVIAQVGQDTPETVAKAYIAATQTADWAKAASFMHPDSLAQLKKLLEPIFANEKSTKSAELLFDVKSRAEFDQLSGAQIFEKYMTGFRALITGNIDFFQNLMSKMSFDVIGQISETPDLVHVLYRTQASFDGMQLKEAPNLFKNVPLTKMEVITLKRHENTWRLPLSDEVKAMMQMFTKISALAAAAPADEVNGAPRKAPLRPAKARKPVRKP